ncbi:MAG: alpha/beta hydrolase [Chloroflexi bacterium]|nr:alpha/beta hydrolase [Chloroflexota bacterium]
MTAHLPPTVAKAPHNTMAVEQRAQVLRAQLREQLGGRFPPPAAARDRTPGYVGPPARYAVDYLPDVVYGEAGSETLCLDLYVPAGASSLRPAVLLFHGGGWRDRGGSRDSEADEALWFAARGIVAATVEYRLAPRHRWPAMLADCQRAVRWLRRHSRAYGIDPQRIAASGLSAGAHLSTLLGLLEEPIEPITTLPPEETYSSMLDLALPRATPLLVWRRPLAGSTGVTGQLGTALFGGWVELDALRTAIYEEVLGAPPAALPAESPRWFDPLDHVTPSAAAFFITHSKRDYLPLANAAALYDALRVAGKVPGVDLELDVIDGTGDPHTHALNMSIEEQSRHDRQLWSFVARQFALGE